MQLSCQVSKCYSARNSIAFNRPNPTKKDEISTLLPKF